jgi:hypothetical protein
MVTSKQTKLDIIYLNISIFYGVENFKTEKVKKKNSMIFLFFLISFLNDISVLLSLLKHTHTHTYSNVDNEEKYVNFVAVVEN